MPWAIGADMDHWASLERWQNCQLSLFAELDGVFCWSKGTDHAGHTLLNTGHEAVQLEFNLSGTDVNTKGTCAGPWARCWKHEGGKPEWFGACIPVNECLTKNVSVHCRELDNS